ncbi:MAG: AAA family ATPase [Candidatus Limnocylindrales bacterium]
MIGRDEDLEAVLAAVSEASAGRPRVVVVAGEAGIGKSRLVREVADRVRAQGDRVLSGGCLDIGDGGLPYLPVAEAIRGLIRDTSDPEADRLLGPAREDVELLLPGLLAVTTPGPRHPPTTSDLPTPNPHRSPAASARRACSSVCSAWSVDSARRPRHSSSSKTSTGSTARRGIC